MEKEKKVRQTKPRKKWVRIVGLVASIVGVVFGTYVLFVVGYVGYIFGSYYRIGDKTLDVDGGALIEKTSLDDELSVVTYNIGFGAYSQDYTFFLDDGYDENGNKAIGYYSTGQSKEEVMFNTNGSIKAVQDLDPDFVLLQEVDTDSTRSYHINQDKEFSKAFKTFDHVHCENFHTAFLPYPFYDMHGRVNAGLTTYSKYDIASAERKQYTIADDLSKLFDLDRCFSVQTIKVSNDKTLYMVNSHMSAYDEGGTIRKQQMLELNTFMKSVTEKGNYLIVGGDFNHELLTHNPDFSYNENNRPFGMTKKSPDWLSFLFDKDWKSPLNNDVKVYAADNKPTCRNNDMEWVPGKTFVTTVDGFITSSNVEVTSIEVIETKQGEKKIDGFAFSDHQPVQMKFKLK